MRVKKQKRHRRIVRFYMACFGFREPFKVLCDGTFIHHLVANHFASHENAISNAVGGSVKLFTTRCAMAELKSLGDSHGDSLKAARNGFRIASCDHEKRKSAVACFMEIIGENNAEHFFIATQDADLRKKFQEIPAVPLMFGLRNALFLEKPSSFQRDFVKSAEEERLHVTEFEYKMLKKRAKDRLGAEESKEGIAEEGIGNQTLEMQDLVKKEAARKRIDVVDKVQFKRKKAKGPNPLSCKKKKNPKVPDPNVQKVNADDIETARSRGRKRKRSRKSKKLLVTDDTNS
ncbi:hypothetical protein Ancab_026434 [Ancistrocladus abbreviatus]